MAGKDLVGCMVSFYVMIVSTFLSSIMVGFSMWLKGQMSSAMIHFGFLILHHDGKLQRAWSKVNTWARILIFCKRHLVCEHAAILGNLVNSGVDSFAAAMPNNMDKCCWFISIKILDDYLPTSVCGRVYFYLARVNWYPGEKCGKNIMGHKLPI